MIGRMSFSSCVSLLLSLTLAAVILISTFRSTIMKYVRLVGWLQYLQRDGGCCTVIAIASQIICNDASPRFVSRFLLCGQSSCVHVVEGLWT